MQTFFQHFLRLTETNFTCAPPFSPRTLLRPGRRRDLVARIFVQGLESLVKNATTRELKCTWDSGKCVKAWKFRSFVTECRFKDSSQKPVALLLQPNVLSRYVNEHNGLPCNEAVDVTTTAALISYTSLEQFPWSVRVKRKMGSNTSLDYSAGMKNATTFIHNSTNPEPSNCARALSMRRITTIDQSEWESNVYLFCLS